MEQEKQPKIVQKLLLRTFFLLLGVAAVFLGINWVLNWRKDPDSGTADTNQMIAAIEILPEGQQAVLFDASGKKIPSPDYKSGKTDRDIVWMPDGNRVFFISDRNSDASQLYRWNPAKQTVEQKSTGTVNRFDPSFAVVPDSTDTASVEESGKTVLLNQGGALIVGINVREAQTTKVLPPGESVTGGTEESGNIAPFEGMYGRFGTGFKTARWLLNKQYLAAVIKREEGEILIIQEPGAEDPKDALPRAIMAGERIDIDVDPKTGLLVLTVLDFKFIDMERVPEQYIKNGKAVPPFANGIFMFDPRVSGPEATVPIVFTDKEDQAFSSVVVSPSGDKFALTVGTYDGVNFSPSGLVLMPLAGGGGGAASRLVEGQIYEVSWHPTGNSLVYVKREGKTRAVFKINNDGSSETKVSDGGSYMTPKFSPQSK